MSNYALEISFETVDGELNAGLLTLGLCPRVIVPQDGRWIDTARFRGSILEHTLMALAISIPCLAFVSLPQYTVPKFTTVVYR